MLSAYINKAYIKADFLKHRLSSLKLMMKLSILSPTEARNFILNQPNNQLSPSSFRLLNCSNRPAITEDTLTKLNYSQTSLNYFGEVIPSFRGFVLGTVYQLLPCRGDPNCINLVDRHYRNQVARCAPCQVNYDAIVKVCWF